MKKILLLATVTICCLQISVSAQKARAGLVGGMTISNFSGNTGGVDLNYNSRNGFTFGMIVDAPIGKSNFSFQPGLHYVQKGVETAETNDRLDYTALRYIEFQGNFVYNISGDKDGGAFFLGAGPTFSAGLPSKTVIRNKRTKTNVETNLAWGNLPASNYRAADWGANFLTGFRLKKGCMLSFNYTLGIRNILPDSPDPAVQNNEVKNGSFGIRLGILVNNPKK